jgi:RNA polymerase sigma-54 factor
MDRLGVNEDELRDAIEEIGRLNPKPGGSSNLSRPTENVIPDYNLEIVDDELELTLNGRNAPELSLSRQYREMLEHYKASKEKNKAEKEACLVCQTKIGQRKMVHRRYCATATDPNADHAVHPELPT